MLPRPTSTALARKIDANKLFVIPKPIDMDELETLLVEYGLLGEEVAEGKWRIGSGGVNPAGPTRRRKRKNPTPGHPRSPSRECE